MSVTHEQLVLEIDAADGLTWHDWFVSLPRTPEEKDSANTEEEESGEGPATGTPDQLRGRYES